MIASNLLIHQKTTTARPGAVYAPSSMELLTVSGENDSTNTNTGPNSRAVVQNIENLANYNASNKTVQRHTLKNSAGERIRAVEEQAYLDDGTDGSEDGHYEMHLVKAGTIAKAFAVYFGAAATQFKGYTTSAAVPGAGELPNAGDFCFHHDTGGGAWYLAFNFPTGGIKKVALT